MSPLINILECPKCNCSYKIEQTFFTCMCSEKIPFSEDIVYFNEQTSGSFNSTISSSYQDFLKFKIQRPAIDLYAAFQPFNESTRAIYPFIALAKKHLKPGDWILDTWCRTGWTSNWLSSLFPEQNILSIWEGNRDILGYDGFNYWFDRSRKRPNQFLVFLDLSKPLPFADNAFSFINGLETLHRYNQTNIIHEIQRITKEDGIILFPHNHLTNAEPDPYFDRGEIQRHGKVYDRYFNNHLKNKNKKHFILSEIELFEQTIPKPLVNDPDMTDYNALIALIPNEYSDSQLKPYDLDFSSLEKLFSLVNPFLKIDLTTCKVTLDHDYMNGAVGRILERHPVYEKRIANLNSSDLEVTDIQIIYWSRLAKDLKEISMLIGVKESELVDRIINLNEKDILQTHLLNKNGARMYYFQSNQNFYLEEENRTVAYLFNNLPWDNDEVYLTIEGEEASVLTIEDLKELIINLQQRLVAAGCAAGDTICIQATLHFEAILLFWAGTMNGLNVEIFNSDLSEQVVNQLVAKSSPKLFFTTEEKSIEICPTIKFDLDTEDTNALTFSDWLSEIDLSDIVLDNQVKYDQKAVTLYTSGSTGLPNAIALTHGMLINSAKQIVDTFKWTKDDVYIATSEIDSMSGLRNTCLATLYSGCKIVIPELQGKSSLFKVIHSISTNNVTIISTTPALLKQFVKIGESIGNQIQSLDKIMSTASQLTKNLIDDFHALFGKKILNYYGLTETSGICISSNQETEIQKLHYLGKPVTGIVQLVDDEDNVIRGFNQPGEIRVYGENVISGYAYNQEAGYKFKQGWIYTGDIAILHQSGYFEFVERKRNIFKNTFGETVYLNNVKSKILELAVVDDVYLSTNVEDDLETMIALIQSADDKDSVLNEISSQLAHQERPQRIIFVDKIPYNSRGKVDNDVINKLALAHEV